MNTFEHGTDHFLTTLDMVLFEYFVTLGQETKLFWGKKLTGAVALFLANRYTTIIYTIYDIVDNRAPIAAQTAQVCTIRVFFLSP